jgi:hypothetical protein
MVKIFLEENPDVGMYDVRLNMVEIRVDFWCLDAELENHCWLCRLRQDLLSLNV